MSTLRLPLAGMVLDGRRKPDAIFSAKVVSGNADFFSASSLTLTLLASSTDPFVYDIKGVRYELQANVAFSATNNAHNFVYIDNTGALGSEAVPPIHAWTAPASPATGQCWYDLGKAQMKRYDGSAWQNVSRIFIGYVRADSGTINARYVCEPIGIAPLDRFSFFGNGTDGFLDISAGTTTIDNVKAYTAVVIRGGTLNHSSSTQTILTVQVQGPFVVLSPGTVNLDGLGITGGSGGTGAGVAGGTGGEGGRGGGGGGGTSGAGGAGGNGVQNNRFVSSGGGTAGTSGGGAGGNGGAALSSPGTGRTSFFLFPHGAAGGGGGGNGSAGGNGGAAGGALELKAPAIAVGASATVSCKGANGSNGPAAGRGAGGGGGGGTFTLWFRNLFLTGSTDASGGSGGTSGGAGSGAGGNGSAGRVSSYQV